MALINSIGAGIYTTFSFANGGGYLPTNDATAQFAKSSFSTDVASATHTDGVTTVTLSDNSGITTATVTALVIGGKEFTGTLNGTSFAITEDTQSTEIADNAAVTTVFGSPNTITNIREFPSFGTPANIVNVPAYGQSTSSQIQGQSDAPTFELTVNYVPGSEEWTAINAAVSARTQLLMEVNIKNGSGDTADNASFWVSGQLAAVSYAPNLTDSNQATITVLVQSDFAGPFADA